MALNPKESAKLIASLSTHVKINDEGINKLGDVLIEQIKTGKLSIENFGQNKLHPKSDDPKCIDWLFVADTLNFCFWTKEGDTKWTVEGYTGYFALCAALNRAIKEKIDILNPKFYSTITEKQLSNIFRSDTSAQVPLLTERVKCLHEVGTCLLESFNGSFKHVIEKAENSAVALLNLIVTNFKCFKDEAKYKDNHVAIYKRAQILIGDIWACYRNKGLGYFKDIDEIAMFADYRIPQSLLYYDAIEYSDELMKRLKDNEMLENGEEMEVEIRGVSIHAVELLTEYVSKRLDKEYLKHVNSILIDHYLWDFRRDHAQEIIDKGLPFHKTFSVYY